MRRWHGVLALRYLTVLLAVFFVLAVGSCGGDDATDPVGDVDNVDDGGGGDDPGDDPIVYDDLTVDSVTGALEAVDGAVTLFYDTLDAEGAAAAALATKTYLEALDEIDTATIEEDASLSILCTNGIVVSLGGVTWDYLQYVLGLARLSGL